MAFSGPLEDRLAIRELHSTYADASFRASKADWLDCWSEDCLWQSSLGQFSGKAALGDQWDRLWQAMTSLAFFTETGAIAVSGDSATARCFVREIFTMGDGPPHKVTACYDDQLVRTPAGWKFRCRSYTILQREGE